MNTDPLADPAFASEYQAAQAKLLSRINYEQSHCIPYRSQHLKLARMRDLLRRLGDPQNSLRIVHIAGTKGKGSTATMIASALRAAGQRVGLFTSPHLERVEERIAVDLEPCPAADFVQLLTDVWEAVQALDRDCLPSDQGQKGPTYFEITTAMALLYFARRSVAVAVLEVGLGGRLDSTNVCEPIATVITSISYDHMKQLGNTLEEIAGEKAGIIKQGVPVIVGNQAPAARAVLQRVAAEKQAPLIEFDQGFAATYHGPAPFAGRQAAGFDFSGAGLRHFRRLPGMQLGLIGGHQTANAAVALATLDLLRERGLDIGEHAIRSAWRDLQMPARIEILQQAPSVILDAAHNVASVAALIDVLQEYFGGRPRTLLFATTVDKDVRGMVERLAPHFERVFATRYVNNPRGVSLPELEQHFSACGAGPIQLHADPRAAWEQARRVPSEQHLICVTGSFFLAAEMRSWILEHPAIVAAPSPLEAV